MKHLSLLYFFIIFVILLSLSLSILFFEKESEKDKLLQLCHHVLEDFQKGLAYENANLLSFSLALSEDSALKTAFKNENEQEAYEILNAISQKFKKYTHIKSLRLQLFDNDFFIFAQSWGQSSVGMPLWWFRDDLTKLKQNKNPKVGMETGQKLTFKATIPIQEGSKALGYLEVIKVVDEFTEKFHKEGIEIFVLMDRKFDAKASLMKKAFHLSKYIIANNNFNQKLKKKAEKIDWKELENLEFYYENNILYLLEPMYNSTREKIGKYLIILPPETVKRYQKEHQTVSLLTRLNDQDLFNVVELWENPTGSYLNNQDKNSIQWIQNLPKEKRIKFKKEAEDILQRYSKDELINIILETKYKEKKVGIIR